jgi:DNA polymerase
MNDVLSSNLVERAQVPHAHYPHGLYLDTEDRSVADIEKVGMEKRLRHPSTEPLVVTYAIGDGPVQIWLPRSEPIPADLLAALLDQDLPIYAHNAGYDRRHTEILLLKYGWPKVARSRWRCTAAMAKVLALPADLGLLLIALGSELRKAKFNIRQVAMPRAARLQFGETVDKVYWTEDPELLAKMHAYAKLDTACCREVVRLLPPLPEFEQKVYEADQKINDAGYYSDLLYIDIAQKLIAIIETELAAEIERVTDGAVTKPSQVERLKTWLAGQGFVCEELSKDTILEILDREDLPPHVRRAIELRVAGSHATIKKFAKMREQRCEDGRIYHSFNYSQASTRRWSAGGVQIQNFAREVDDVPAKFMAVMNEDLDALRAFGDPLDAIGDTVRAVVCASPGHKLLCGDLSAIESRQLARLVGETAKIEMWDKFDAGEGTEPYVLIGEIFGLTGKIGRRMGKLGDLAFSYGAGVKGYRKFMHDRTTPAETIIEYQQRWQRAHPRTKSFWYEVEDCAIEAILNPGTPINCRKVEGALGVTLIAESLPNAPALGLCLFIELPSGGRLCYPKVRLFQTDLEITGKPSKTVFTFMDNSAGQWREYKPNYGIWGGTLTNHITQSYCRDILAEAILQQEAAGRSVIVHRHDSIICEVPL